MKKIALIFIFCSLLVKAHSQVNNYYDAMKEGNKEFGKGEYKKAINYYFAAAAFMPENKGEVKEKVNKAFDEIETLRKKAEKSEKLAQEQKLLTDIALAEAKKQQSNAEVASKEALIAKNEAESSNKKLQEFLSTVIGAKYKGGKIAWKDSTGKHGIIAADMDIPGSYTWDSARLVCNNYSVTEGDSTYVGWHLPTKNELNSLYVNKDVVGGFKSALYWSSSESNYNEYNAWFNNFGSGDQNNASKEFMRRVRAVRAF